MPMLAHPNTSILLTTVCWPPEDDGLEEAEVDGPIALVDAGTTAVVSTVVGFCEGVLGGTETTSVVVDGWRTVVSPIVVAGGRGVVSPGVAFAVVGVVEDEAAGKGVVLELLTVPPPIASQV